MSLEEFQHLLGDLDGLDRGSLRVESGEDDHDEALCEYIPGNPEESPYYLTLRSEMKEMLAAAIAKLSDKEQQVLSLYYYEELTMKEVGAVLGVGESRISQIHSIALLRLRSRLQEAFAMRSVPPHLAPRAITQTMEITWKRF